MLRVEGLDVWFGGPTDRVDAVQGVNFTVARGESRGKRATRSN
jgi:peptide/nickel transport system ATP-binding protein